MSDFFYSQLSNLTADTLSAIATSSLAVACADGSLSQEEVSEIVDSLNQVTGDVFSHEDLYNIFMASLDEVLNSGVDETLFKAGWAIDDPTMREVAFLMASATAWAGKGVNTNEGVALQKLANELGIKAGSNRYFELLGEGKALVGR